MKKISFLLVLLSSLVCSSNVLAKDFSEPRQSINSYIMGVSKGSGEHVEAAFTADATIKFYDRQERYRDYTRDAFAKEVNTGESWDAQIEITALLVTGNAANATVEFTWGDDNEHGYVDYLNLIRIQDNWYISNKVAQYTSRK